MSRRTTVLAFLIVLVLVALGLRFWLSTREGGDEAIVGILDIFPSEDRLVLEPAGFGDLPGWRQDEQENRKPPNAVGVPAAHHRCVDRPPQW